jgi:hypothetical protein
MQKIIDDSYEILELNESEPIVFHGIRKNQKMYHDKSRQVMLVVPKEMLFYL